MTFLPVVERELRVAARRRATHVIRLVAASVGFGVTIWILIAAGDSQSQEISGVLFSVMVVLVFLFAFLVAPQITADCISEEKRDGTLGLLFLTDLKGYDIVFGKLVATSLHAFYGMLALAPIMAIPLLMGGISRAEVFRALVISLNLLCFSLSAGLLASAICRRDARAHSLAFGIAWLPLLCPFAVHLTRHAYPKADLVGLLSPVDGCFLAFDEYYKRGSVYYFWLNAALTQIYSWIFLGLACWLTPRSWQDQPFKKEKSHAREQQHPTVRSRRPMPLLDLNPFQWRASRARFRQSAVWLFLAILAGLWMWATWAADVKTDPGILIPIDLFFLAAAGLMLKAWIAAESGRALGEDRRSGALELLLSTRLSPRKIINGQLRAVSRQFALPICALVLINLVALIVEFAKMRHSPQAFRTWEPDDRALTIGFHVIGGLFLVLDSVALIWVGMWRGFIARKPNRAVMPAMFQIVLLPGILFLLFISIRGNQMNTNGVTFFFWGMFGLGADLFFWIFAFNNLMDNFRTVVSEGRIPKRTPPAIP